jgi:hypothetical protein
MYARLYRKNRKIHFEQLGKLKSEVILLGACSSEYSQNAYRLSEVEQLTQLTAHPKQPILPNSSLFTKQIAEGTLKCHEVHLPQSQEIFITAT